MEASREKEERGRGGERGGSPGGGGGGEGRGCRCWAAGSEGCVLRLRFPLKSVSLASSPGFKPQPRLPTHQCSQSKPCWAIAFPPPS
ncbi:Hypothetical predicted protein [Podarcis lilfordi]|uniref:Uncharacterized protein n=1 Tax=Podarcis lilfordi TaxID=74358 RepID=A0AA35LAF9_9SAUR|nr:Hypothetical predicted protein [Podarcis lilfordi]